MRFTALTLLALGASTSAYVVPNNKQAVDNAVKARMPVSWLILLWMIYTYNLPGKRTCARGQPRSCTRRSWS
jgi:hypothetical protein